MYQLSIKDLSRVYVVNIRSGKASLIPHGQAQIAAINTLADPVSPPVPATVVPTPMFNLTSLR